MIKYNITVEAVDEHDKPLEGLFAGGINKSGRMKVGLAFKAEEYLSDEYLKDLDHALEVILRHERAKREHRDEGWKV